MSPPAVSTQLMLALEAAEGAAERLEAVLAAVPVACIIVKPSVEGPLTPAAAGPLVDIGQKAGSAVLIEGDADLARTLRADGVHIPGDVDDPVAAIEAARAWLGGQSSIGVDAAGSRHAAMTAGEKGADYVAFASPDDGADDMADTRELIAWWAEIFEVPVVAVGVGSAEEARECAQAGADFVCIDLAGGMAVAEAAAFARDIAGALGEARTN